MKKDDYPLAIANLLGIPPIQGLAGPWMSSEGTVLSDWVRAVAEALDLPYTGKVATMRRLVESVGVRWDPKSMASETTASAGGGNISTPGFAALLQGLERQPSTAIRRASAAEVAFIRQRPPDPNDDFVSLRAMRVRRGQPSFRSNLLTAYRGRCAISDTDEAAVLEAAHIVPYGNGGSYETSNGLLLRSDLHLLFDTLLIAIDTSDLSVVVSQRLTESSYGSSLAGLMLALPGNEEDHPDLEGLDAHRVRSGF